MKVIKINNVNNVSYLVRHWFKWYFILDSGFWVEAIAKEKK